MSLITAEGAHGQGYQAIPLPRLPGDDAVLTATPTGTGPFWSARTSAAR